MMGPLRQIRRHADSIALIVKTFGAMFLSQMGKSVALGISVSKNKRDLIRAEAPGAIILTSRIHKIAGECVQIPKIYRAFLERCLMQAAAQGVRIFVWGYADQLSGFDAKVHGNCVRLEQALFGVSATLDLPVFSYVRDRERPYFDGRGPSDLEVILNSVQSGEWMQIPEEREFIESVQQSDFQKYQDFAAAPAIELKEDDIVVVGQCRGDAAWTQTVSTVRDNVHLVGNAISEAPRRRVFYKPHPYNSANSTELPEIEKLSCHGIIPAKVSFAMIAKCRPHIVVNTSGAGLEAALRGCQVETYGISFYSNWGFTQDHVDCLRRRNRLTAEDVFWALTKYYTQYFDRERRTKIDRQEFCNKLKNHLEIGQ